ncbi:hypothetical protein A3732_08335 [Oleiphilus sp. HI0050]|nr:hypothetical protein A3732_08335 [Oleiphilus sp. HI0050]
MNGRSIFKLTKPILSAFYYLTLVAPAFIFRWCWPLLDLLPSYFGVAMRYVFARRLFKSVGDNLYIARSVTIKNWSNVVVGNNVSIHEGSYIDGAGGILLGNNVSIAHHSSLISFEHTWEDENLPIKYNPTITKNINIHDDVWIGCGVRILAGSIVKSRSVVGAGSVLKGEVDSNCIFAGVPARRVKSI